MSGLTSEEFDSELYAEAKDLMGERFAGLIEKYFSTTNQRVSSIEAALQKTDTATAGALAHNIKSTSASFGFLFISATAKSIESICRNNNLPDIGALQALCSQLRTALQKMEHAYKANHLA